jgi:hypothetical protein
MRVAQDSHSVKCLQFFLVLYGMNLISMSLFSQQTRYWYTLFPAIIANLEMYPGFRVRLHITTEARQHPATTLLDALADALPRLEVYEYSEPYTDQEPTFWRMRPLWDANVDAFFPRDVDSVPYASELKAVRLFLDHPSAAIHSVRSYHLHTTLLMAGLCGFKTRMLDEFRGYVPDYETYVALYHQHTKSNPNFTWGCDQEALRTLFSPLRHKILDCPIGNCAPQNPQVGVMSAAKEALEVVGLDDLNADMLEICREITEVPWGDFKGFAGRPHGDFRPYFQRMLALPLETCQIAKDVFAKHPTLKEFYA